MGLGGAYGAVGADFTTTSMNPAGLGLYKMSEISVTPAVFIQNINSTYNGILESDSKTNFYMGNAGLVITSPASAKSKKSGFSISILQPV